MNPAPLAAITTSETDPIPIGVAEPKAVTADAARNRPGGLARAARRWLNLDTAMIAALLLVTFALYVRTAGFDFVDFDDSLYFASNGHLALGLSPAGLRWALTAHDPYWHPIPWICYLAMAQWFGQSAAAPHLFNGALHAASAGLLFLFWRRSTKTRWTSFIATALWAWHPLRVESVAWVSETKDVLGSFFWIGTLLCYVSYARRPTVGRYAAVSVAFALALCSKPTAVTLPAVLLLLDYWPLGRLRPSIEPTSFRLSRFPWRLLVEKVPWLLLAALLAGVAYWAQRGVGALELNHTFPLSVRLANAVVSFAAYLRQTFWPTGLAIFYPYPNTVGVPIPVWKWAGATGLLLAISVVAVREGRRCPSLFVGWFWFLGAMLPMIGLVQSGIQARADRHTLIPSIGLMAAIVWPISAWAGRAPQTRRLPTATVALLLAVAECVLSIVQIGTWRDSISVFSHAVAVTQNNFLAESGLAVAYAPFPQRRPEAMRLAWAAVSAYPHVVWGFNALGVVHDAAGDYPEALAAFQACVRIQPDRPAGWERLGDVRIKLDQFPAAEEDFIRALRLDPRDFAARNNLAICLAHDGQMDRAIVQWRRVVQEDPHFGPAHGWLADALRLRGDRADAEAHYRAALLDGEQKPAWEYHYAWLVATRRNVSSREVEAVLPDAMDAVRQLPADPLALDALAAVEARDGQFDQAAAHAAAALRLLDVRQPRLSAAVFARLRLYQTGRFFVAAF